MITYEPKAQMIWTKADRAGEMAMFAAIVAEGSLSGAARILGLTPSAISRSVSRLENRLGVRLLLRTTRALTLTAEGQAYLAGARRMLADLDELDRTISDQGAPRGKVRVSAALSHGRLCVTPAIGKFVEQYPHIKVDLSLTDAVVDIAAGEADVAIRFGQLADSSLKARRLGSTGRTIVASPAYLARNGEPTSPEDLSDHNCLNFNFRRAEPIWPFRRDGRDFVLAVTGNIEANNGDTLVQLACEGVGIARVGAFNVVDHIPEGRLVPLLEAFNPGDREAIHVVFVGGPHVPARVRVLVEFLVARLGEPCSG